uniref:Cyclic nucleotide-binding domain-containing protein n=1 Tax=Strigamia maritima TaxID=126957 RepID=T1ISV5_STRMM
MHDSRSERLKNQMVQRKIKGLVKALSARTERAKEMIVRPITPDPFESPVHDKEDARDDPDNKELNFRSRENSIFEKNAPFDLTSRMSTPFSLSGPMSVKMSKCLLWVQRPLNSQGWFYMSWQFLVLICFCYNSVGILLRVVFPYQTPTNLKYWLLADYTADAFYFADILLKLRVKLIVKGLIVSELAEIPIHYVKSTPFVIQVFWDFFNKWDRKAKNPYIVSYVRCYLFAVKAATSIGKNPKPIEQNEYLFMTFSWLAGVFIFAILIGQNVVIKDILSLASQVKQDYRQRIDRVHAYMHHMNIPLELQDRINTWFEYNWQENKGIDEEIILNQLPKKMKSDLALYIHFNTLKKVQLFRGLETELLKELVLKLKPMLFLPGDYICKKGDVGTEMYIFLGGPKGDVVLATLGEGSVFGEVSLLALAGGNRRNADVRSKGYSDMFVLDKRCLQDAVREFPGAEEILHHKARKLMNVNHQKGAQEEIKNCEILNTAVIENPKRAPQMAETVLRVIMSQSAASLKQTKKIDLPADVAMLSNEDSSANNIGSQFFSLEEINEAIDNEGYSSCSSSTLSLVSCSSDEERGVDEMEIAKYEQIKKIISHSSLIGTSNRSHTDLKNPFNDKNI